MEARNDTVPVSGVLPDASKIPKAPPFLLMQGGPFYRIERRIGIVRENAPLTKRRAVIAAAITWLPLLVFTLFRDTALGSVRIPFLHDFSAYTRFLLGIPLLLLAELIVAPRIAEAAEQFLLTGLVLPKDYKRFDAAIEKGLRLRDSVLAEIVILFIAYAVTLITYRNLTVHTSTWYSMEMPDGSFQFTGAGWWQLLICVPLLQFLVLRWCWRIFLWFRFLGTVSKLDLRLFPTHPDEAGGLGFVGEAQRFFGLLLFAYSCSITGVIANQVVYGGTPLQHFAPVVGVWVVFALLLAALPLVVFTPKLLVTKRRGLHEYGALATAYTGSFHQRWIEGHNPEHERLLGTGDIQSLADLGGSYEIIEGMMPIPIDPKALLQLVITALLPMVTLLLTVMPLKEVLKLLMKIVV
ncbi:hypothetical protein JAO29_16675 [Edaphobacter sp. HDX4]|uniref:hypothetical protein n=1 Tax=Edaphobacter sp. HDX4 TaxID=2794064 RepID=UPI002FE57866